MNFIYALVDPRSNELRYIGKTNQPEARLKSHCNTKTKTYSSRWVQKLRGQGLFPKMIIIEKDLSDEDWPAREQHWILHYRELGAELTNITDGGYHMVKTKQYCAGIFSVISKENCILLAKDQSLTGTAHKVLFYLIARSVHKEQFTNPRNIIELLGLSAPGVYTAVKLLHTAGYINRVSVNGNKGYTISESLVSRGRLKE